jgi:hypothetical protein
LSISDPDPKTATKERDEKLVVLPCCSYKNHKIDNFELVRRNRANLHRILELSTQKIVTKLSKIWGSGSGSGIQGSNGDLSSHEIARLNGVERASAGGKKRRAIMSSSYTA